MTIDVDIVVVGGGGAGLAAAAEAARLGRSVIVLEKAARLGGTTWMSVGSLMGACTRMQRAAGIEDSPAQHDAELAEIIAQGGLGDNPALRRVLVEHLGETVDFLESIGVDFIGPLPQPPFRIPRFYQALPGGHVYVRRLAAHCRTLGVEIRLGCGVTAIDRVAGRVTGVQFACDGTEHRVTALCGVILAAGDLSADRAVRRQLWGTALDALEPINVNASGDGQRIGIAAGGEMVLRPDLVPHGVPRFALPRRRGLAERLPPWRPVTRAMRLALRYLPAAVVRPFILRAAMTALAPERALYAAGAVMVNRAGDRFVDEQGAVGSAIAEQADGEAYVLFDGAVARRFSAWPDFVSTAPGVAYAYVDDYRRARPDIFHEASTIEGLAAKLGCSAERLAASLSHLAAPSAPFVAMGPLKTWLLLTPAGLGVTERMEVVDDAGAVIPGLYAAGGNGQSGLSYTHYHHGHSLGWAMTSGRLAGRAAAFALVVNRQEHPTTA